VDESSDSGYEALKKFANAEIVESLCLPFSGPECGACISACANEGAVSLEQDKPVISQENCVGCALCRDACIVEEKAIAISSWYE